MKMLLAFYRRFLSREKTKSAKSTGLREFVVRNAYEVFVQRAKISAITNIAATIIVGVSCLGYTSTWILGLWVLCQFAVSAEWIRLYITNSWGAAKTNVDASFFDSASATSLVSGLLWGVIIFALEKNSMVHVENFITLLTIGLTAAFAVLFSILPRLVVRFTCGSMLPLSIYFFTGTHEFAFVEGALMLLLCVGLVRGTVLIRQKFVHSLKHRLRAKWAGSDLREIIETFSDGFVLRNSTGQDLMSNSKYRTWFPNGDRNIAASHKGVKVSDGRWVELEEHETDQGNNVFIYKDVTALKTRERELTTAYKEAEDAVQAKLQFLSGVSRELSAPVAYIVNTSALMSGDSNVQLTQEEIAEFSDKIERNGKYLRRLIDDLTQYSRVGDSVQLIEHSPVSVHELLDTSIELATSQFDEGHNVKVEQFVANQLGNLIVDSASFTRIILNLVLSGLQRMPDDKVLIVRAGLRAGGSPFISIRDFGPPIEVQHGEGVFTRQSGATKPNTRNNGGHANSVLSLRICAELAKLHDAKIDIKSGRNTNTVTVTLPARAHVQKSVQRRTTARKIA